MNKRCLISFIALMSFCSSIISQNVMRIHYHDGTNQDIYTSQIDSVTFIEKEVTEENASLTGSWLWGKKGSEYYELISFNDDHTYTGYDNYFTYGFDTMTYGWYSMHGNMLTLTSNGYGYQRIFNWFVMGMTSNALEVMTRMGQFTYYRLQPDILRISQHGTYTGFSDADTIVFADGVVVKCDGNLLQGITSGTTYILLQRGIDDTIVAYKVIVD